MRLTFINKKVIMKLSDFEKEVEEKAKVLAKEKKFTAWVHAMRLRTLPLSLSALVLGGSFALMAGIFSPVICFLSLLTGILLQILSNFANDYGDGTKGTDGETRVGPARMIASGLISQKEMLTGIKITVGLLVVCILLLLFCSFGNNLTKWLIFGVLGIASIVAAMAYTMGKNPYGYRGKGDLYSFIFFGPVAVLGSYFLYGDNFSFAPYFPSISAGLLSSAVLNVNNIRDMKSDAIHGKNTLALRLGEKSARQYHLVLVSCAMLLWAGQLAIMHGFGAVLLLVFGLPVMRSAVVVSKSYDHTVLDKQLKITAIGTGFFHLVLSFVLPVL